MKIHKVALALIALMVSPACADPISGYVNANGVPAIESSLYTVAHLKRGHYLITFTTAMSPRVNCVITTLGTDPYSHVRRIEETETSCLVVTQSFSQTENVAFSFIAVPMSN